MNSQGGITLLIGGTLLLALAGCGKQLPPAQPPGPDDRPVAVAHDSATARLLGMLQPCTDSAKQSYPRVRARFLAGLPDGSWLAVTVRLAEPDGRFEQIFVRVERINADKLDGRISSRLAALRTYRTGQAISVSERSILDWTIVGSDGTEEGNYIGKALDRVRAGQQLGC